MWRSGWLATRSVVFFLLVTHVAAQPSIEQRVDDARRAFRSDVVRAVELARVGREAAERAGRADLAALALAYEARAAAKLTGAADAVSLMERARGELPSRCAPEVRGRLLLASAQLAYSLEEYASVYRHMLEVFQIAEQCEDPWLEGWATTLLDLAQGPDDRSAERRLQIAELFERAGDPSGAVLVALSEVREATTRGRFDEAVEIAQRGLSLAEPLADHMTSAHMHGLLGAVAESRGQQDVAARHAREALASARKLRNREVLAVALTELARRQLLAGDSSAAAASIGEAVESLEGLGMTSRERAVRLAALEVANARSDTDAILAHGRALVPLRESRTSASQAREWQHIYSEVESLRDTRSHEYRAVVTQRDTERQRFRDSMLVVSIGFTLVLGAFVMFVYVSKRRSDAVNARLVTQSEAARRAVESERAMEKKLRHIERLDGLGLFAGGFAHDFNNLLHGVSGNAELLRERLTDPEQRACVDDILSAASRASELCQQIQAYAGDIRQTPARADLRELVTDLVPMLRAGVGPSIALDLEIGDEPCVATVDRVQIQQVVVNMVTNACDAISESGTIKVRVWRDPRERAPTDDGFWYGSVDSGGPFVCIEVEDTGEGIEASAFERLFDPFYSTRMPGRGLGLAAAWGILRRHDALVRVESESGSGSRFTILLPAVGEEAADTRVGDGSEPVRRNGGGRGAVLVVDDEASLRTLAVRALTDEGYETLEAQDGESALELLRERPASVSCILLDLTMPGLDGASTYDRLRERGVRVPVIVMSGHLDAASRGRFDDDVAYLPKPFLLDDLRRAVAASIDGRRI